jgi:putative ABC transport system permease protein
VSEFLETVSQDVRYALRGFRHTPAFALTAILTLALAIGGNSAIFSMIRAVLLRPLPWPDPNRLVIVWETNEKQGTARANPSSANFFDWREESHSFDVLAHWRVVFFNLSANDGVAPERVQGARVAATFLSMLGAKPVLGRGFFAEEEQPGRDRVAIFSYGFWQRRFGASRDLLGRQILIDGEPVTVVGILPREFRMGQVMNRDLDLYLPFANDHRQLSREDHAMNVYGRLRRTVSLAEAEAEMNSIAERLEQEYPATNRGWRVRLVPLPEAAVANSRPILLALMAAVGIVLLIACVNIANLMLSRTNSRSREFALRVAVGASRGRVIRQLFTESLLLGLFGGAAGLLLARWAIPILVRISYLGLPRIREFRIDAVVLGFSVFVSLLAGLLFGLAPAVRCSRVDLTRLKVGVTAGVRVKGNLLMFAEVVLTTMLLIAGGAVLKEALRLVRMNRGLNVHQVLTMQIWLPEAKYPGPQELANFFEQLLPRVRALPGVESASVVNYPPLGLIGTSVRVEGQIKVDSQEAPIAHYWIVSPEYFHTVGLSLRRGRLFDEHDADQARSVVVISERLALHLFPGQDAIGKYVRPLFPTNTNAFWIPYSRNVPFTIVGIVPDIIEDGLLPLAQPQMYLPYRQNPTRITHLLMRTAANPLTVARAVRSEVSMLDPNQPVFDVRTLESVTEEAFSRQQVVAALLGVFAGLALLLAAVGINGVVSSAVSARTREMGIRTALGARRRDLIRLVVMEALRPVLAGIGIGLAGAVAANRILSGLLVGLETWDSPAAAVVCLGLIAVATGAAYVPALWAVKLPPVSALRCE